MQANVLLFKDAWASKKFFDLVQFFRILAAHTQSGTIFSSRFSENSANWGFPKMGPLLAKAMDGRKARIARTFRDHVQAFPSSFSYIFLYTAILATEDERCLKHNEPMRTRMQAPTGLPAI
jgi:hypothetical protein